MRQFIILTLFLCTSLEALERGLEYKREGQCPITHVQVFSERCSGSTYVNQLVRWHFFLKSGRYGHKHFTPWLSLVNNGYTGPRKNITFEGSDDHLILILFRNPFDWLQSFHRSPWDAHPSIARLPFSQFIRSPWIIDPDCSDAKDIGIHDPFFELDPKTARPFKNPMRLRSAKIKNMLAIKERCKNCYIVQYESVLKDPKGFLTELEALFGLAWYKNYEPIHLYKGNANMGYYAPKDYGPISLEDRDFICEELDEALEARIGYIFS